MNEKPACTIHGNGVGLGSDLLFGRLDIFLRGAAGTAGAHHIFYDDAQFVLLHGFRHGEVYFFHQLLVHLRAYDAHCFAFLV